MKGDKRASLRDNNTRLRLLRGLLDQLARRKIGLSILPAGFFTLRRPGLGKLLEDLGTLLQQYPQITVCTGVDLLGDSTGSDAKGDRKAQKEWFVYVFQRGKVVRRVKQFTVTSTDSVPPQSLEQARTFNWGGFSCGVIVCGEVFCKKFRDSLCDATIIINTVHGSVARWDKAAANWSKVAGMHRGFFLAQHLSATLSGKVHDFWDGKRLTESPGDGVGGQLPGKELRSLVRIYEIKRTVATTIGKFFL